MARKGRIAPGLDADIAIWNPEVTRRVALADQHDNMDYTPFEGMELTGVPEIVMTRGQVIVEHGELRGVEGQGQFVARERVDVRGRDGLGTKETALMHADKTGVAS